MIAASKRRQRLLIVLVFMGLLMWAAGALALLADSAPLSLGLLTCGGILAVTAAYTLLTATASGRREHANREAAVFCLTFGLGAASVGLAVSPLTHWLAPAVIFFVGGLALMAWSPQAFRRSVR